MVWFNSAQQPSHRNCFQTNNEALTQTKPCKSHELLRCIPAVSTEQVSKGLIVVSKPRFSCLFFPSMLTAPRLLQFWTAEQVERTTRERVAFWQRKPFLQSTLTSLQNTVLCHVFPPRFIFILLSQANTPPPPLKLPTYCLRKHWENLGFCSLICDCLIDQHFSNPPSNAFDKFPQWWSLTGEDSLNISFGVTKT